MNDSLSIIVPVRDAEATLQEQVHDLLDVLPDLTAQFEIVLVDDGSTDHTVDLAHELIRRYPQLRLIGHRRPLGKDAAVKTGLASARGRTVLVQENAMALSTTDLRRLWSLRCERDAGTARPTLRPGMFDPELLERLSTWGQALRNLARRASPGGIQMIRSDVAQPLTGGNVAARDVPVSRYEQ